MMLLGCIYEGDPKEFRAHLQTLGDNPSLSLVVVFHDSPQP